MSATILPLQLVDFEHYMLVDDEHDYPMVIPVWLRFDGILNRDRLVATFKKTVEANPLLRAIVENREQAKGGTPELFWVSTDKRPVFEWTDQLPEMVKFDLFQEPGLRVFAKEENGQMEIRLFVHHCVSDGVGITQMVEQWLTEYQNSLPNSPSSNAKLQNEKPVSTNPANERNANLANRGKFGMNFWKYLLRPFQEFCGLIGAVEYFSHRPVAIGPQEMDLDSHPEQHHSHQLQILEFSEEETAQILQASKSTGNKVNDMMVAAIFEACHQWLVDHHPEEAERHLRVIIPINMRNRKQPESFVANVVSMTYLDRRPGRYKSIASICRYAWLEMTAIKMMNLGLTLIHIIRYFRKRGKLQKLLRRDRSIASITFSNLGRVFNDSPMADADRQVSVDGVHLKSFHFFPPIRPYTWISTSAVTYAKRLMINCNWCSRALSRSDAEQILTRFKHNLLTGFSNNSSENETEMNLAGSK